MFFEDKMYSLLCVIVLLVNVSFKFIVYLFFVAIIFADN